MTEVDVPAAFWGLWRRHTIAFDGAPAEEPALVFWCQAPRQFMDLRWRIGPPEANEPGFSADRLMAGYTTYEDSGFMTWHHDIDSLSGEGADRSAVRVVGDELTEEGEIAQSDGVEARTFVEIWRRVDGHVPTISTHSTNDGQQFIGEVGGWHMEISLPVEPSEPAWAQLKCGTEVSWTLGGTFAEFAGHR
jgi:hypothetical protein